METTRHIYCLDWPPSLNHQKVNRAMTSKAGKKYTGRMWSEDAARYRDKVFVDVRAGHRAPPRLSGRLSICVLALPPDTARARDLDNYWKILLDSMKRAEVFLDDSLFDDEHIYRGNPVDGGRLLVSISRYDPDRAAAELLAAGLPTPGLDAGPTSLLRREAF